MRLKYLWLCIVFFCGGNLSDKVFAQGQGSKVEKKPYTLLLTPRLHTAGHFPFGGAILNTNLNTDVDIYFKRGNVGVFLFKSLDLSDRTSPTNYSSVGMFQTFKVSSTLEITSYTGYFLSQVSGFKDPESDMWAAVDIKKKVNKNLQIIYSVMMGNLVGENHIPSMTNRLNVNLLIRKFKFDTFVWYNHTFGEPLGLISSSMVVTSPEIEITEHTSVQFKSTYMQHVSDEKPDGIMRRGLLISLIIPIDLCRE